MFIGTISYFSKHVHKTYYCQLLHYHYQTITLHIKTLESLSLQLSNTTTRRIIINSTIKQLSNRGKPTTKALPNLCSPVSSCLSCSPIDSCLSNSSRWKLRSVHYHIRLWNIYRKLLDVSLLNLIITKLMLLY